VKEVLFRSAFSGI